MSIYLPGQPRWRTYVAVMLAIQLVVVQGPAVFAVRSATHAPSAADQYRAPDGSLHDIPPEAAEIFRYIPETNVTIGTQSIPYKLLFLTLCTGPQQAACVTQEQRRAYIDLLTMRLHQPERWRAMHDTLRVKVQAMGVDYEVAIDPEYLLEKNLQARATTSVRSDGTPWVRVNPLTVNNPDLLDLALVHEDEHVKQHRDGTIRRYGGDSSELREAKLEVPAYAREYRLALRKRLEEGKPIDGEVRRIRERLQQFFQAAKTGAPDQVFIFGRGQARERLRVAPATTLERLLTWAREDVAEQTRQQRERLASGKPTTAPTAQIPFTIDPATGNWGIADRTGTRTFLMEHDDMARAMGFDPNEMIRGFLEFRGETGRWVIHVHTFPRSAYDQIRSPQFWAEILLAALAAHPDGPRLNGAIVEIQGVAELQRDSGRWWRFEANERRLVAMEAEAKPEPTKEAWRQAEFFERTLGQPVTTFNDEETADKPCPPGIADPPPAPPPPSTPASEPPRRPAARDPLLEAEIERFLDSYGLDRLRNEAGNRTFSIFQHELFKRGGKEMPSAETAKNAWKAVCSKPKFAQHSGLLAFIRQEALIDIWSEISVEHQIRLELIDSGRRRGYVSDLDVTAYSPSELRGKTMLELVSAFGAKFQQRFGYKPGLDITMHDGEAWIPDVRNSGLSVEEYTAELKRVVGELRAKVAAGGDAYVVPGANVAEVQRRGLRDGRVIQLKPTVTRVDGELRMGVDRNETMVSRLDPQPGRWKFISNSQRFDGVVPIYDPGEAFPILAENIEHLRKNGDRPTEFIKYFNRAVNTGAGAGQVNTFADIHGSNLRESMRAPDLQMIDQAFAAERRGPIDHAWMNALGKDKTFLKTRWIIRAFGLAKGADADLLKLYDLLDRSAEMQREAERGSFSIDGVDPRTGKRWLAGYLQDAAAEIDAERPELKNQEEARTKAVQERAFRKQATAIYNALVDAMVKNVRRVVAEMTPEGMRRNSFRYMHGPNGPEVMPNTAAAAKQAERRRVELALAGEIIAGIPDAAVRERLFATLKDKLPPEVAGQVTELLRSANVENVLRGAGSRPNRTVSDVRLEMAKKVTREQVTEQEATAMPDKTFFERQKLRVLNWVHPLEAPLAERVIARLGEWDKVLVDSTSKDAISRMFTENVFMTTLMTGAAVTGMAQAYREGGWVAARAAGVNYAFMMLPPVYGVPAMVLSEFSRGHFKEGMTAIGVIALMHKLPILGDAMFMWDMARGSYVILTEEQNEDLFEQALRSRPAGLAHATRNPITLAKLSQSVSYVAAQDTPELPLFFDNPCMKTADVPNDKTVAELLPIAAQMFRPKIWKDMIKEGYSPASYTGVFSRAIQHPYGDTSAWDKEYQRRLEKYAFDVPYYLRVSRLSTCYGDEVLKAREIMRWPPERDAPAPSPKGFIERWTSAESWSQWWNGTEPIGGFDFSSPEAFVFSKVVSDWFNKQPKDYQDQYDRLLDFGSGATRTRALRTLTAYVSGLYWQYSLADSARESKEREIAETLPTEARKTATAQKMLALFQDKLLPQIQNTFNSLFSQLLSKPSPTAAPQIRFDTPRTFVAMDAHPVGGTETAQDSAGRPAGGDFAFSLKDDAGLEVEVLADRAEYPQPWAAGVKIDCVNVRVGPPEGFVPTAEERRELDERGPNGETLNGVITLNLNAQAVAYRAPAPGADASVEFARSVIQPIVGYAIIPVPSYLGSIKVSVRGTSPDGTQPPGGVEFEATIANQTRHGGGADTSDVTFDKLKPQRYTVSVRSLNTEYENGTAAFEIKDPFKREYLGRRVEQPDVVQVLLRRKPKPPTPTTQNQPPNIPAPKQDLGPVPRPSELPAPPRPDPDAVQDAINNIGQLGQQCEHEAALAAAQTMLQKYADAPEVAATVRALIAMFEPLARRQREARTILLTGQQAIQRHDVEGAIAALVQAGGVAPECMEPSIQNLLEQLIHERARARIAAIDAAELNCDYSQASSLAHAFGALTPRTPSVDEWIARNVPRIDDLNGRQQRARGLLNDAMAVGSGGEAGGFRARTGEEWLQVLALLQQARAVPPPDCDLARLDGLIGRAGTEASKRGDPGNTKPGDGSTTTRTPGGGTLSILGSTTTTADPAVVKQGGRGPELGGKPASPSPPPVSGSGTTGASGKGTRSGRTGSTGSTTGGSGGASGSSGGSGPDSGSRTGSTGTGGVDTGGTRGSTGRGQIDGCNQCFINQCTSQCAKVIVLLCVVSQADDACRACAQSCGAVK